MKNFFIVLSFYLLLSACTSSKNLAGQQQVDQGIRGVVLEKSGNQMPSPGMPAGKGKPFQTTIYIYEITNTSQVKRNGTSPFYDTISTRLIKTVESDEKGYFTAELPVGSYSVFTRVKEKYYSNDFDAANNIGPVIVQTGKVSEVNITVSAAAYY